MFVSGILLAAGHGTRMGADKLFLPYKGRPLIECALIPLADSDRVDEVIVVARPGFRFASEEPKCRIVYNADHAEGLGASLRAGVAAAHRDSDAFVVSLADMPELTVAIVDTLIAAFGRCGKPIVVPLYEQRRGHPVVIGRSCRADLLRLCGDRGARSIIGEHPEWVEQVQIQNRAVVFDVDVPDDLELRQTVFDDARRLREAVEALEKAGVYFEIGDAAGRGRAAIRYGAFDEERVRALWRSVQKAESPCAGRS